MDATARLLRLVLRMLLLAVESGRYLVDNYNFKLSTRVCHM